MDTQDRLMLILDELLVLINESEMYQTDAAIREILGETRKIINDIRRRALASTKKYIVAVVGLTNVGKSTLLNALFGLDIAPRRNGPCTAAPIEFAFGDSYEVTVYHFKSITRPSWRCAGVDEVHERLTALADDSGAERSRSIQRVVVTAPLPILQNGLVIADTPGFGAAQIEGAEGSHEESLKKYLVDQVSQVFWVVLGEQGIGKREKDFHDNMFGQICDDVIVTGCDDWEQRDKDKFRQRFARLFNRLPQFHFASGKIGLNARKTGNTEHLEQAGIVAIENRIRNLANRDGRLRTILSSLLALSNDLICWWDEYRNVNDIRCFSFWRPDSWDRWKNNLPNTTFTKKLANILEAAK
ncbi:MAG: dynamin family protein [Planctomycetaceae bacterium]|jgi:GTP-binding protein EngB required for normal cell division|nr:dynamin family protein [Planctomycetaceae bacterium]